MEPTVDRYCFHYRTPEMRNSLIVLTVLLSTLTYALFHSLQWFFLLIDVLLLVQWTHMMRQFFWERVELNGQILSYYRGYRSRLIAEMNIAEIQNIKESMNWFYQCGLTKLISPESVITYSGWVSNDKESGVSPAYIIWRFRPDLLPWYQDPS